MTTINKVSKFITGRNRVDEQGETLETQFLRINSLTGSWDNAMGKSDAHEFTSRDEAEDFIDEVSRLSARWNRTPYQYFIREMISEEKEIYKTETIPEASAE